jgi:hypothetical protein
MVRRLIMFALLPERIGPETPIPTGDKASRIETARQSVREKSPDPATGAFP